MNSFHKKESPPVTIKTFIEACVLLFLILVLVMLREIFPSNEFVLKYFNKGYLVIEVLIIVAIAWGIDVWRKKSNKRRQGDVNSERQG